MRQTTQTNPPHLEGPGGAHRAEPTYSTTKEQESKDQSGTACPNKVGHSQDDLNDQQHLRAAEQNSGYRRKKATRKNRRTNQNQNQNRNQNRTPSCKKTKNRRPNQNQPLQSDRNPKDHHLHRTMTWLTTNNRQEQQCPQQDQRSL